LYRPTCLIKIDFKDWIPRQLQLFLRSSREKQQISRLEPLPLELLLLITTFLETADIICLSLCSRTLNNFTTSLYNLNKPIYDKPLALSVLIRLVRDLPRMFCCHRCGKLHPITDVLHPARSSNAIRYECSDLKWRLYRRMSLPPSLIQRVSVHCLPSKYTFHHCHLAAVMQNHDRGGGRYGINADSLAYTEVVDYPEDPARTTLLSVEGRICTPVGAHPTPSLVLQMQQWVLFHDIDIVSGRSLDVLISRIKYLSICCKHTLGSAEVENSIRSGIRQQGFCLEVPAAAKFLQCSLCGVEFQIALCDCGKDGKAVILTKWLDLGVGMDVEDPKWKKATLSFAQCILEPSDVIVSSGDVRRLFCESSEQESDPTMRNKSYLEGRRYRRVMVRDLYSRYGLFPR
ncbi:uncharacterized protein BO97DRAFT_451452, partial [Aspergillus homomorphus CBS 101889]